ncbi:BolA/IbaG family iron-sulfur metabolism protein [Porticoccaceae bacterium]|nr:BolA/IbaG family iron-sulfur metabolism protein [Porticoccaceae bacterium]MDA8680963.1 BolA/IbaG family iron-sulfur metabolism protein [Porticoccaceae bacterium]MDB2343207.1 BolA/IbaG family iron-sulfur metabolism protein [Porticoccaceae bacterium]MDB2634700.1 BolA/IbaG family iron-sulfur metabolism protein [Porticoccaceae bacterium]
MGPIERSIVTKLRQALMPIELQVLNESSMHNVPPNSETHFKIVAVSEKFDTQRLIQRHQAIYNLLSAELAGSVHALALHTYSPSEWIARGAAVSASPKCRGG